MKFEINSRSGGICLRLDPRDTLLHSSFEVGAGGYVRRGNCAIGVLVREQLECAEINFWNAENILAVNALGSIEGRTNTPAASLDLGWLGI
jgi:hypothetical protein